MGRGRKKGNDKLTKGIYITPENAFRTRYYDGTRLVDTGTYPTEEEAQYKATLIRYGHHWVNMDRGSSWGFVYRITNKKTGKMYIGKKQFLLWRGPPGGYKCSHLKSEWYDKKAWVPNDWREYTGSQKDLTAEIAKGNVWDFDYEVIEMCSDKLDLHICEVYHQVAEDVLEATDEHGEYLYYNKNIAGIDYRAPFKKKDLVEMRAKDEEAMRNYYLRPKLDAEGNVMPFKSLETGGIFHDIR